MVDLRPVQPAEGLSLSRWSRLKRRGGEVMVAPSSTVSAAPDLANAAALPSSASEAANVAELNLPQLSSISLVEDFTPFMQAKVPQALRQQALKALFKEPHFNVMDGLDTYIDDYTVFEPISPEVMATLSSWKTIMNPTQQVVTPGGYAVDVESEEGKAVLAARAEVDPLVQGLPQGDETLYPNPLPQAERGSEASHSSDVVSEQISPPASQFGERAGAEAKPEFEDSTAVAPIQHPRHNKRVGDFAYIDAPARVDTPPLGAEKAE